MPGDSIDEQAHRSYGERRAAGAKRMGAHERWRRGRKGDLRWIPSMDKVELEKFKIALEEKREEIIKRAEQTLRQDMALDSDDFPDEMDLASSEYLQAFTFRLRGREKVFLTKIQKALERIGNGTFGTCEECGEPISNKRLEARPETTLCIRCKEDQERVERDFG